MRTIYEPKGRALEYSLLALNLYDGCSHGCRYPCYVSAMPMWRSLADFSADPKPREGVIEALRKEAPRFAGTDKRVLLCFTCDPYQPIEKELGITRQAIEILRANRIPFTILTKAGDLAMRDFSLYGPDDIFAVTLTSIEEADQREWEPGAAPPIDRMSALLDAHRRGIKTWVSLEPVLDPKASLLVIAETQRYVNLFKIGTWNHARNDITGRQWASFGRTAVNLCEAYGTRYYVKDDLAQYLDTFPYTNTDTRRIAQPPSVAEKAEVPNATA